MIPAPALEIAVLVWGMILLLGEAFAGKSDRRIFAFAGILGLAAVLLASFFSRPLPQPRPRVFGVFIAQMRLRFFSNASLW